MNNDVRMTITITLDILDQELQSKLDEVQRKLKNVGGITNIEYDLYKEENS